MAQLDGMRSRYADESSDAPPSITRFGGGTSIPKSSAISRFASFTPRAPTIGIATVEQLLRGGGGGVGVGVGVGVGEHSYSKWATSSKGKAESSHVSFDPEEHHSPQLTRSPSVLARVKEKATLWRRTLSARRQSTADPNITPSWGVSLDDIDDPFYDDDPEYLGAPTYDSEQAPEEGKEGGAKQQARAVIVADNHIIVTDAPQTVNPEELDPNQATTMSVKLGPDLSIIAPVPGGEQNGVSVKEYIMHKLEPGEDEKALSQMIVEAMSPRSASTSTSTANATTFDVVGKMRDAVNSLLRADQVVSSLTSVIKIPASHLSQLVPAPADAHQAPAASASAPAEEEEENRERIQTN